MASPDLTSARARHFVKPGYVARLEPEYFVDDSAEREGLIHQPDVYPFALELARRYGAKRIIDIGCGSGAQTAGFHEELEVVGIDVGLNIERCRAAFPSGTWIEWDLRQALPLPVSPELLRDAVVVCADVIEHLVDSRPLLDALRQALEHAPVALLSTPDRDLVRGGDDVGPPQNVHHVREWSSAELDLLLTDAGLEPLFLGLTRNNDRDGEKKTALAVLRGAGTPSPYDAVPDEFRAAAIVTAYNEADVLAGTVHDLGAQGLEVHVIDNWSDDGTYELAQSLLGRGVASVERWPAEGPTGRYDWGPQLERVAELAATLDADWVVHHDADERRRTPWPGLSLRAGYYFAQLCGFNAIDHTVAAFHPVDERFEPGDPLEEKLLYWQFGGRPGHFVQIKAWRNEGVPVDLACAGGHDARFPGQRVFPFKFLLKHYSIRSQAHGEQKILRDRLPRRPANEVAKGWHAHYAELAKVPVFTRDPNDLTRWEADGFRRDMLVERLSGVGIARDVASIPQDAAAPSRFLADFRLDPVTGVHVAPGTEQFGYADGAEAELLRVLDSVGDRGSLSQELRDHVHDWPSLYHLTPYRWTILDCLGFSNPATRVLELGAGCGAVTRWLGERVQVDAVEGSHDRAAVVRSRCRDLDTVRSFVANIYGLEGTAEYDVATLIGVLEYAHTFHPEAGISPAKAAGDMLRVARKALVDDGVLVIAIENKLGLKYLSGACEDHSGRQYDGIVGYPNGSPGVTWSARELEALVREAGFADVSFFLPFPDYKLASTILAADNLNPSLGLSAWIDTPFPDRVRANRDLAFNEALALAEVERAGLLKDLANSFVVVAYAGDRASGNARAGLDDDWVARHYALDRHPAFCKRVTLSAGTEHVIHEPVVAVPPPAGPLTHQLERESFAAGELLVTDIFRAAARETFAADLAATTAKLRAFLLEAYGTGGADAAGVPLVAGDAIDVVPWNVVVDAEGVLTTIDREWTLEAPVPVDFVLWRGFHHLAHRYAPYFHAHVAHPDELVALALGSLDPGRFATFAELERVLQIAAGAVAPAEQTAALAGWGARIPHVAEVIGPQAASADARCVLAWADEIVDRPEILQAFVAEYGSDEAATIAVYAPGWGELEIAQLEEPLEAAELSDRAIVLTFDAPDETLAARVDAILTDRPPPPTLDALPRLRSLAPPLAALVLADELRRHADVLPDLLRRLPDTASLAVWAPDLDDAGAGELETLLAEPIERGVDISVLTFPRAPETDAAVVDGVDFIASREEPFGSLSELPRVDAAAAPPLVSIVIPVHDRLELTRACLDSIAAHPPRAPYEVIVVDNASSDGTRELLLAEQRAGRIKTIRNRTNLGFARACNRAAAVASGRYLVLLNNDTVAHPGWLDALVAEVRRDQAIGAAGSRLLYPDGSIQHAGMAFDDRGFADHVLRGVDGNDPRVVRSRDVPCVTGACLLLPLELFRDLGGLDEEYEMYVEDVDLCLAIAERGLRIRYVGSSVLTHLENASVTDVEWRDRRVLAGYDRLHAKWGVPTSSSAEERDPPAPAPGGLTITRAEVGR